MDRLLSFERKLEIDYRQEIYQQDINRMRFMLVLCVFFYSIFAYLDVRTAGHWIKLFTGIRFFVVNPIFLVTIILSFHNSFRKFHQLYMSIAYLAAGTGIIIMLAYIPNNFSYYGGLFLIFAVGHFLTHIYWYYAMAESLVMVLFYILTVIIYANDLTSALYYVFFYVAFIVICSYASYIFDQYRRENYLQTYSLKDDKVTLERENYNKLIDVENANRITIFSLARLAESRDQFTGDHIERVGTLCLSLSQVLGEGYYKKNHIDKEAFLQSIELASTLHDIGKVSIPEHILMKPGRLTDEEMAVMQEHTIHGYNTLMNIRQRYEKNDFVNMGIDICKYHHEKWNGQGYPEGLSGQTIPLSARIVAVVDVYDALISERPYKKAFTVKDSLEEIVKNSGVMFDPTVVEAFLTLFDDDGLKKHYSSL